MNARSGVFHIEKANDFFSCLCAAYRHYEAATEKRVEDIFFLIMGLNHLREWIAPCYDYKKKPTNEAENFFNEIYKQPDFRLINDLCNNTKHLSIKRETDYKADLPIDEWSDISSVIDFDAGPPSAFYVDGGDIIVPLERLLNFYRDEWFSKSSEQ